tara:strand:+ start:500 stop:826 length:327 start_codon:yes stop_codon:yes gene_type:complete
MKFKNLLFVFLISFIIPQETEVFTLTAEEMQILAQKIEKLQNDISIYTDIVKQDSITIMKQDSLFLVLNQKYDLCEERLTEIEPGLLDNKYLWFLLGLAAREGVTSIK